MFQEVENQNDDLKQVSGGLEELNNILSVTQKKLHRFKVSGQSIDFSRYQRHDHKGH